MADPIEQIYNAYLLAEAELNAMSGYEQDYPDYFDAVRDTYEHASQAYNDALAAAGQNEAPNHHDEEAPGGACAEPGDRRRYSQSTAAPIHVAGAGDLICFQTTVALDAAGEAPADVAAPSQPSDSIKAGSQRFGLARVRADAYEMPENTARRWGIGANSRRGYGAFRVSARIADALNAAAAEIRDAGGILTSSGATRDLNANVSRGRSATSFHYSGLAIDLYTLTGTLDPATDRYVITRESGSWKFRVNCRVDTGGTARNLDGVTFERGTGRMTTVATSGSFVDLTAILERHGFERINARSTFRNGPTISNRLAMEWWHYQYTRHLESGTTTFGDVLKELYTEGQLRNSPPWQYRSRVFNGGGFT